MIDRRLASSARASPRPWRPPPPARTRRARPSMQQAPPIRTTSRSCRTRPTGASTSLVGGKPFTSYVWPTTLKKPVLYPLRSANGVVVTRGYPLEPRAGRARRPSASRRPLVQLRRRERPRLLEQLRRDPGGAGVEVRDDRASRPIRSTKSGAGEGVLETTEEWVTPGPEADPARGHEVRLPRVARRALDRAHHDAHGARRRGRRSTTTRKA